MRSLRHCCSRLRGRVGFWTGIGGLCLVCAYGSALTGQSLGEGIGNRSGAIQGGRASAPDSPAIAPVTSGSATSAPPQIAQMLAADGVLGFASPDGMGGQMVTLVHASRQWMTVYAISSDGEIRLRSSRPLDQDFSVHFNLTEPTPAAIKQLNSQP